MVKIELTKHEVEGAMISFMFFWYHGDSDQTDEQKVEGLKDCTLYNKLYAALTEANAQEVQNDIPKR